MRTAVDLFAGGGGAALGLRRAGYQCRAHVEWDPAACSTLRAAVAAGVIEGDVIEGDVRAVDWTPYVGVDLVWASPPCQAWSSAGKRLGAQDERNGWPWTWAAVDQIRPTWLICENVGGLLHHLSAGHPERTETTRGLFGDVTRNLGLDPTPNPGGCARCYWDGVIVPEARRRFAHVDWRLLDCADWSVPQHRERLILVCGPESYRWPVPTHRDPRLVHAVGKPWVTVREALGIGVEGVIEHDSGAGFSDRHGLRTPTTVNEPSPSITAGSKGSGPRLILRERHPDATPDAPAGTIRSGGNGHSAPPMWLRTECTNATARPVDGPGPTITGQSPTYIHASDPGTRPQNGRPLSGHDLAGSEPWRLDMPSPCVTAVGECKGSGEGGNPHRLQRASDALFLGTGRRRLTTDECAALQSFPPDWPWRGNKTEVYRQIGNAAPAPLVSAVASLGFGEVEPVDREHVKETT